MAIQVVAASDLNLLLDYINSLITEDAYIYRETDRPVTLEEEQAWLNHTIDLMNKGNQATYVAKADGKIVGVGNVTRGWMKEREQGRFRFSIAKDYRDQGIGGEMIEVGVDLARQMELKIIRGWIFSDDQTALYLAKKMNFVEGGKLPNSVKHKGHSLDQILVYRRLDEIYNPQYGVGSSQETPSEVEITEEDIV